MKKILCALLLVAALVSAACAAEVETVGVLTRLDVPPEVFKPGVTIPELRKYVRSVIVNGNTEPAFSAYDSMATMLMALNSGNIDVMLLPESVAEYVLRTNPATYANGCLILSGWMNLVMGLKEGNEALRDKISAVINEMTKDGSLSNLIRFYVQGPEASEPVPVVFEHFEDAETLKVAVTGDFPPIDYVDAGGQAAGYNTAFLAELGRRLHMNVQLVYTETAARAAALTSGRADVVFWFKLLAGEKDQADIPDGIITTAPYYGWNKLFHVGLAK